MNSAADKLDRPPVPDQDCSGPVGPQYVNAAPPPMASAKALGVTCAFFGMIVSIGAFAALTSGRFNRGEAGQSLRGAAMLGLGLVVFLAGAQLLKRSRQK